MATQRALLLIADIGGYTDYMQFHRSVLGHAEAATSRILGQVVDAAKGFQLVEVEGDAAFLSRDVAGLDDAAVVQSAMRTATALHRVFHRERRYVELNMCPCGSCSRTSGLTLKFVAHVGEVATQTIQRRTKLVGPDVIEVHRLLKNPVPLREYLLVSGALHALAPDDGLPWQATELDLEGLGRTTAYALDVGQLPGAGERDPDPSLGRRLGATLAMVGRGLPHLGPRRRTGLASAG